MISHRTADILKQMKREVSGKIVFTFKSDSLSTNLNEINAKGEYEVVVKAAKCLSEAGFEHAGGGYWVYDFDEETPPVIIDGLVSFMIADGFEIIVDRYNYTLNYKVKIKK